MSRHIHTYRGKLVREASKKKEREASLYATGRGGGKCACGVHIYIQVSVTSIDRIFEWKY